MNHLSKDQRLFLNKLVADCIAYNLIGEQAVVYVRSQLKQDINIRTINIYKKRLQSDEATRQWYSDFARIRFVRLHSKVVDDLERSYNDTNEQMFKETLKSPRNEGMIIRLKLKLEETAEMMSEFASDTPVIDAIRQKIEGNKKQEESFTVEPEPEV